mmetsp:Transcript_9427/g.31523  ORF Transcript_9427/g.31523 Transcript_9427/m.31523 type:complete len:95 (+) Transcript_9427:1634-1918(+)
MGNRSHQRGPRRRRGRREEDARAGGVRGESQSSMVNGQTATQAVYLLQRKTSKHGDGLGKTTGWIHRKVLKDKGVQFIGGVAYDKVTSSAFVAR